VTHLTALHSPQHADGHADHAHGPVLLFLHGYGSDERDLAGLVPYLPASPWASVRAPLSHPASGYAWYPLDQLDVLAPAQEAIGTATAALWEWVDASLGPAATLIPVGFSQGGCMASQLLRTRPERVAGAALLSGYVQDAPQAADATLAAHPRPVFWGRGDADPVIPVRAIEDTQAWVDAHAQARVEVYAGLGHSVSERELRHLSEWLDAVVHPAP